MIPKSRGLFGPDNRSAACRASTCSPNPPPSTFISTAARSSSSICNAISSSPAVGPCKDVLAAARGLGMLVIHTREGHRPDLTDAPPHKVDRGDPAMRIGAPGPMGRILVRGEPGHDIIPELYPGKNEPVIDKPGKGAFYQTDLDLMLRNRGIDTLLVCGVTTEVCVNTTVREANDRGYRCIVLSDCCASYFPQFHEMGLAMIKAQGGIFGSVASSQSLLSAMAVAA
jgi:biuret amidohydrolase